MLLGGKVYNVLQAVMTAKVVVVLVFCLGLGLATVAPANWWKVFSGFAKFGNVPVSDGRGGEVVKNAFAERWNTGEWPIVSTTSIVVLGAFAGYAGGGGLANSTYSNFVRDKGWGMGCQVGAIPSAIGGRNVTLSHVGKVFPLTPENLERWRGWWRHVLTDQVAVWGPGCFMGMALPALLSMQFVQHSTVTIEQSNYAQALITADGLRHAGFNPAISKLLWIAALFTGLMVMMPSQMSIVDDFSRRWTDAIWSASRRVRETDEPSSGKVHLLRDPVGLRVVVDRLHVSVCQRAQADDRLYCQLQQPVALGFDVVSTLVDQSPAACRSRCGRAGTTRWASTGCGVFYLGGHARAEIQDLANDC